MKILKVDPNNPNQKIIDEAVRCLKRGGVLIYPTDTCYGLGADMTNPVAIEKIYKIKQRPDRKPLSLIVRDREQLEKYALLNDAQNEVLAKYFPGPYTFILQSKDYKTFKQSSIGVRVPKFKLTRLISDQFYSPYATTSANISNQPPCYDLECLLNQFGNTQYQPNLILDAGTLPKNQPSTIVDLSQWPPHVIRQGGGEFSIDA